MIKVSLPKKKKKFINNWTVSRIISTSYANDGQQGKIVEMVYLIPFQLVCPEFYFYADVRSKKPYDVLTSIVTTEYSSVGAFQ